MHETGGTRAPRRSRSAGRATLPAASAFRRRVRDALAHLNDPVYLRSHPLSRIAAATSSAAPRGSSSALQQAVLDAIRSLQPDARAPAGSAAWRRYRILELRYEEGGDARTIQAALPISKGEYYREHREAIQAVVAVLWERFRESRTGIAALRDRPRVRPRSPLPVPLTGLIGREPEMAAAMQALAVDRLVTLTGPPGTGKTRLALELARGVEGLFADGVYFVNLAAITDPELVIQAIARAMDLEPDEGGSDDGRSVEERLVAGLQAAHGLLVLDNFEQVVEAGPAVVDLLQYCPEVTALVTSRVPLRVRGEREMPVPPLGIPAATPDIDTARAAASGAVQLFVERAQGVRADFDLTDGNAPAVAELCVRLDGLPLALELAAARCDVLSPEGILARLDTHSFAFEPGLRDLPPRQRTLNAAIAWSYELLDEEDQALFRRLAVFTGGWSLAGAEAVVGGANLVAGLARLLRSCLVQRRTAPSPPPFDRLRAGSSPARGEGVAEAGGGEGQFAMLETIRAFGLQQLEAAGEREVLYRRHAGYFSSLVESADWARARPLLGVLDPWADSARRAREHLLRQAQEEESNLRAALGWATGQGDGARALWLAAGLAALGYYRGQPMDERPQLEAALLLPGAKDAAHARAVALEFLGELAGQQGDQATARAFLEEELQVEERLADERAIGFALLALRRIAFHEGRHADAHGLNERALRIFREIGESSGLISALDGLGQEAIIAEDLEQARRCFEEVLSITRHPPALCFLGVVAADQEKLEEARQCLHEFFLRFSQKPYHARLVSTALQTFTRLAAVEAQPERAFRLAGADAALRAARSLPFPAWLRSRIEPALALAAAALDERAREAAWAEGQQMTTEGAIDYALSRD